MNQTVLLAMLAKEPTHGYELQARLASALGPLSEGLNAGQVYVTLSRLEKAGLVIVDRATTGAVDRPERKAYRLTAAGQDRLADWLADVSWPRPDVTEFHLKLVAAAAGRLADPVALIDGQRRALLSRLRDAERAAIAEPAGSAAGLLLEGVVLRLQADLRWLEACERQWSTHPKGKR